jgi:hypothetical protein
MTRARSRKFIALLLFAVAVVLSTNVAVSDPAETNAFDEPIYLVTYAIYDLPVYRIGPPNGFQFDPSLLVSHLKKTVDPQSWRTTDATITPFPQNLSVVIAQTKANHAEIAKLLESMRSDESEKK